MRWERGHRSANVEDRRRGGRTKVAVGAGGGLVTLILVLLFGGDVLQGGGAPTALAPVRGQPGAGPATANDDKDKELVEFVSFVLDDIQDTWAKQFQAKGLAYRPAKLVLFSGQIDSACGLGQAATGPFYCPGDQKAYIDLAFYRDLKRRFGAPGDFAQAYVLAHEMGHHVQRLLGTSTEVHRAQQRAPKRANALSVRLELQADCYAGVWAHSTSRRDLLERGDIAEGLGAAAAVGDDTLQRRAGAQVQPERWTHGSSKQRVRWFRRGLKAGDMDACDTFQAKRL